MTPWGFPSAFAAERVYPQALNPGDLATAKFGKLAGAVSRKGATIMRCLDAARERVERATDLAQLLDASYCAFTTMLDVIQREQESGGPLFGAFMMAGHPASSGRLAVLTAPSLPAPTRLSPSLPAAGLPAPAEHTAEEVASLSLILAYRLDDQAAAADNAEDRDACVDAARHAWTLHARLG